MPLAALGPCTVSNQGPSESRGYPRGPTDPLPLRGKDVGEPCKSTIIPNFFFF